VTGARFDSAREYFRQAAMLNAKEKMQVPMKKSRGLNIRFIAYTYSRLDLRRRRRRTWSARHSNRETGRSARLWKVKRKRAGRGLQISKQKFRDCRTSSQWLSGKPLNTKNRLIGWSRRQKRKKKTVRKAKLLSLRF